MLDEVHNTSSADSALRCKMEMLAISLNYELNSEVTISSGPEQS